MIKYFADNKSIITVFLPIIVILHFVLAFYFPPFSSVILSNTNLWDLDFSLFPSFLSRAITTATIVINALLVNYIFNHNEFFERFSFLPGLTYVLLLLLSPIGLALNEDLWAQTFFILFLHQLFTIKQNENSGNCIFLSGFFLGITATLSFNYTLFYILLYIALLLIRPFHAREFLIPIIGFVFPFMWVYLINPDFYTQLFFFNLDFEVSQYSDITVQVFQILIVFGVLLALRKTINRRRKSSIRQKKTISIAFIGLFLSFLMGFWEYFSTNPNLYPIAGSVLLSFFLPYIYLDGKRKKAASIFFYALILLNIIKFFY